MQGISSLMLRVLLNKFHEGKPEPSLKCLPNELANQILALETRSTDTSPFFESYGSLTEKIHYSWLIPIIQKFPVKLHEAIISTLSKNNQASLRKDFPTFKRALPLPTSIKRYFLELLYLEIKPFEVVLPEFLPQTSLSELGNKNKNDLVEIIDYLGLFDLAEKIRLVVDKNLLTKIYSHLSPLQHKFIVQCLKVKPRLAAPQLDISKWSGDQDELDRLVHRRGLARFAKALSGQHPDFVWYICHVLDKGRGTIVQSSWADKEIPGVTALLIQQMQTVEEFLASNKPAA